jgi:hypothetical protein
VRPLVGEVLGLGRNLLEPLALLLTAVGAVPVEASFCIITFNAINIAAIVTVRICKTIKNLI